MKDNEDLMENEKVLIEAFKLQNEEAYDEALDKLQIAGNSLIHMIENIQASSEFYMRNMQLMKQERDLVSEKDYKQFLAKNDQILSRNFEKNAYLALLMQEIEERETSSQIKKWTPKQDELLKKLSTEPNITFEEVQARFPKHKKQEVLKRFNQLTVYKGNGKKEESLSQQ